MCKWTMVCFSLMVTIVIAACGPKSVVVLLPDPDGNVGRITVSNEAGSIQMDQAHLRTVVGGSQKAPATPTPMAPDQVRKLFATALASQPPEPIHFMLYFYSDSADLLPDSKRTLPIVFDTIDQRMPTTISVIGHSDTRGDRQYNQALSLRRAQAVQNILEDAGIAQNIIEVSSHGEENPLVKTADGVANAQNRRVEVIVR